MKKTRISVTDAARNFTDCLNRTRYQSVSFLLLKNGDAVAELTPAKDKVCTGRDLAEAIREVGLPEAEAKAWRRDLRKARKSRKAPVNKWE